MISGDTTSFYTGYTVCLCSTGRAKSTDFDSLQRASKRQAIGFLSSLITFSSAMVDYVIMLASDMCARLLRGGNGDMRQGGRGGPKVTLLLHVGLSSQ